MLKERGLWQKGLVADCATCKNERKRGYKGVPDRSHRNCCARRIVKFQPDFQEQKNSLEELVEARGHVCLFLPKLHCELNFIEMVWGRAKYILRENCTYTLKGLLEALRECLMI